MKANALIIVDIEADLFYKLYCNLTLTLIFFMIVVYDEGIYMLKIFGSLKIKQMLYFG